MRILLIDDSLAYHEEFAMHLDDSQIAYCQLDFATTAEEGARELARGSHDIYFTDYRLPGCDGLDLVRQARSAGLTKPIIVLTGFDSPEIDFAAEQAGANDFLEKGRFSPRILNRAIRYAISNAANAALQRMAVSLEQARSKADEANRAKSRFLASMSHELRTPLNGILGYAQILQIEGGLTVMQSERVAAMMTCGRHLLDMISYVLDMTAIESDGFELHPSKVDVVATAQATLDIVRPAAEAKGLKLHLVTAQGVPPHLLTDSARLRQVLLNLLGNAVKYTAHGAVTLRLSASAAPGKLNGALCFDVLDTGPGIPAALRKRLFKAFDRLNANSSGASEGAGVGLFVARELATLLGGTLSHANNPSGGSIFSLKLPLTDVAAPILEAAAGNDIAVRQSPEAVSAMPLRVLVVDDVAMNRDIVAAFIRSASYEAVCVASGAEAIEAVATGDFAIVLMDVCMPGMDGREATRRIRALDCPHGNVPIVALTAQVFTDQIEACRKAGMDLHLAKPFTYEEMLAVITRGIHQGSAASAAREHW